MKRGELVDTTDLKLLPSDRRAGSSPVTINKIAIFISSFINLIIYFLVK
jgi:hypothetical protein